MYAILAQLIGGMGLFFYGLHTLSMSLQQLSSRRFRELITRFTDRTWMAGLIGFLAGALTQSTSAVTIVLGSLNSSGLVTVRRSLPIVAWANVGTCVLVFLTVLDIRVATFYLLGLSGIAFAFSRHVTRKSVFGAGLGIGLLLIGMRYMKQSAVDLNQFPWFQDVMAHTQGSFALALLGGALVSFVTQSSTAVIMIAVAMINAGLVGVDETIMIIYGGNVGSTFARMIMARHVKGSSRQIGGYQDIFKIVGTLLFSFLFVLEVYGGVPLVKALAAALSGHVETQMALVHLLYNLTMAVLMSLAQRPLERLLAYLWPPLEVEDLGRVQYLHPLALDDPESALDLVEKEQTRLANRLPHYLDALRTPAGQRAKVDCLETHRACGLLWSEVEAYLAGMAHNPLAPGTSARVTNVHSRHGVLGLLEEGVYQLSVALRQTPPSAKLAALVESFVEALDFILLTADEAIATRGAAEAGLLATLCADRGELMGKIRGLYFSGEHDLPPQDKSLLLDLTTLFDRIVWMLRRLAGLLEQSRQAET
jgi:phosphate:Na+ symporter